MDYLHRQGLRVGGNTPDSVRLGPTKSGIVPTLIWINREGRECKSSWDESPLEKSCGFQGRVPICAKKHHIKGMSKLSLSLLSLWSPTSASQWPNPHKPERKGSLTEVVYTSQPPEPKSRWRRVDSGSAEPNGRYWVTR